MSPGKMTHSTSLRLLLLLLVSAHAGGDRAAKHLQITAGHVFPLECPSAPSGNVTWSWGQQRMEEGGIPAGIQLRDQTLWFFPAEPSHSGNYSCAFSNSVSEVRFRDGEASGNVWEEILSLFVSRLLGASPQEDGSSSSACGNRQDGRREGASFVISVANETCPPAGVFPRRLSRNTYESLDCGFSHIRTVQESFSVSDVAWMKDCHPLQHTEPSLTFLSVTESDGGQYTCFVNFTHEGRVYTAAETLSVSVAPGSVPQKPRVVRPQQERHTVTVGEPHVLNCTVFVGTDAEDPSEQPSVYWLVDSTFPDDFSPLIVEGETTCTQRDSTTYYGTPLKILEVKPEFLHIPFTCFIISSKGTSNGTVILVPPSQSELHCAVGLLTACTAVVLGLLVFYFLKVDLVLAYRKFSPCVKPPSDGKLYDAYVSYICSGDQSASSTAAFALRALPEVLEDRLGYRLFIRGRDDPLGAAVPDVISESVGKSRRLIIVLAPQTFSEPASGAAAGLLQGMSAEHPTINNNTTAVCPDLSDPAGTHVPNWGPYEWWVGLYDALVKEGLQVILIQVGEKMDEAQLPESLRYVLRKQGVLRWKQDYSTKPGTKFWKQLHYRMPPVQRVQPGDVV